MAKIAPSQKLLTIVVPSYNRHEKLDRCLSSVFYALDQSSHADLVDVLVVDDFSSDPIEAVITKHRLAGRNLRFFLHDEKCGIAETAMLRSLAHVDSKFAWVLGNDDTLFPDAFTYLIPILQKSESSFFLLNFKGIDAKGLAYDYLIGDKTEIVFERGERFFANFGFVTSATTFPCLCFEAALVKEQPLESLFALSMIYSHTSAFYCAFHDRQCSFIPRPLVTFNHNEALEEAEKLHGRNKAFLRPAYYHASAGLARQLQFIASQTGKDIAQLAGSHEDELDKDTKKIKRTVTAYFVFLFTILQFDLEMRTNKLKSAQKRICFSREDVDTLTSFFRESGFQELSFLFELAKAIYGDNRVELSHKSYYFGILIKQSLQLEAKFFQWLDGRPHVKDSIHYGDSSGAKPIFPAETAFMERRPVDESQVRQEFVSLAGQ